MKRAFLVILACLLPYLSVPIMAAESGFWNFSRENREHPQLEFRQGRRILFFLGVGRAYGLHIACPGPRHPDGPATLTIVTPLGRKVLRGEFEEPFEDFKEGNEGTTFFLQWDMGFDRSQVDFDEINREFVKFVNFLADAREIVIDVDGNQMVLPRITVSNLRKRFGIDDEGDQEQQRQEQEGKR